MERSHPPWVLTLSREQVRCGLVPMLPTDTPDILEVHPWHNTVVVPNLQLAP
jgi:hypothetical protein